MAGASFFAELRKRKVLQAAAIYGAVSWGVTEVVVTVTEQLFLPQWISTLAVIGFVVGFPVAMFLSWTFDITSDGIQRTSISSRRGTASIALSITLLIAGTAGLFFLIKPSIQETEQSPGAPEIVPNSIAVLPFENTGQDPDDAYLSEGLSDELRDQLSRVSGMRVAARSSSVAAHEQRLDALAISTKLRVANLVEGSVRRQGNTLRISVQLIEGRSGLSLWSETFSRGPRELLTMQELIAERIAMEVLPDSGTIVVKPTTNNASANELLLLARHYEQQVLDRVNTDEQTLVKAIDLYRQATEADPGSALAHSRLAGALLYLGDLDAAAGPAHRAMDLDPNLSEVQNTMGQYYWAQGLPDAGPAYARAIELNPYNPDALQNYATWHWTRKNRGGRPDLLRRAVEVDRLSISRHAALGGFLAAEGYVDETFDVIRDVRELFDNDRSGKKVEAYRLIGALLELIGRADEAIAWTLRARDFEPDNPDHVGRLAELYATIGDFETALELEPKAGIGLLFHMRRYPALIDTAADLMIEEPDDIYVRYLLAFGYNAIGKFTDALYVLSTTGQPLGRIRSAADVEGKYTLINALEGAGSEETKSYAVQLAESTHGADQGKGSSWWYNFHTSCGLAIMGRKEEALDYIARVANSPQLPWDAFLRDAVCMKKLTGEPVYEEMLSLVDERRAEMREKLPATLAEFGVELWPAAGE